MNKKNERNVARLLSGNVIIKTIANLLIAEERTVLGNYETKM